MGLFNNKNSNTEMELDEVKAKKPKTESETKLAFFKKNDVVDKVKSINKDEVEANLIKASKKLANTKVSRKIIKELDKKGINKGLVGRWVQRNKNKTKPFVDFVCTEGGVPVGEWVRTDLLGNSSEFRSTNDGSNVGAFVKQEEFNIGEESPMGYFGFFFLALALVFPVLIGLPLIILGCMIVGSGIGTLVSVMGGIISFIFLMISAKLPGFFLPIIVKVIGAAILSAIPFMVISSREKKKKQHFIGQSISTYGGNNKFAETLYGQAEKAWNDRSPFITLGTTTGKLYAKGSEFSPKNAGSDFGLTMDDLTVHMHIFGESGTGKTASLLKPTIKNIIDWEQADVLLEDLRKVKFMIKEIENKYTK